jgi:hypothetical protein
VASVGTAICFLVINQIEELPYLAITSALRQTQSQIFVGYTNAHDIVNLPTDNRLNYIELLSLGQSTIDLKSTYQDFSQESFYQLVQLKWDLLIQVLSLEFDCVIYSDLDIIWNQDAASEVEKTFNVLENTHVLIQNFTEAPSNPRLCMGFVGFRNSDTARDFIKQARKEHSKELLLNAKTGDDDVVTKLYRDLGFPAWVQQLPQSTFPVGNVLNLYVTKPVMPGLRAPNPFIFHSNYVVGLRNKRLMSRIFLGATDFKVHKIQMSPYWFSILTIKRIRYKLSPIKAFLRSLLQ